MAVTGRFAPSPTGPLHLGSLVAALGSYLFARSCGGRWLLRIDDLDAQRVLPGVADDMMATLEILGFQWDGEPLWQSTREAAYAEALGRLEDLGMAYPCGCSRGEIARIATAPHGTADELAYPGTCRDGLLPGRSPRSIRVRVPDGEMAFIDGISGPFSQSLPEVCGDFVVKRADGLYAYHLATVVDDGFMGVNQVVRGADLLTSTPRQIHLQRLLGLPEPAYFHLPLVTGPDGGKLSKRDCAVSLAAGRDMRREGGALLLLALEFLGQPSTGLLLTAPPGEILAAAVANFDRHLIPAADGPFPLQGV